MTFPKEVYKGHHYRVIHGPEEYAAAIADGWENEKPEGSEYIPVSAIVKGKPDLAKMIENEPPLLVKRGPGRPRKEPNGDNVE